MTLRRKILLSFVLLSIVNGLLTLLILEAAYLTGGGFRPEHGANPIAPGLGMVAASLAFGAVLVAFLLFWTLQRLVLDPIDELIAAARDLAEGANVQVGLSRRRDEIGTLADSFNIMAEAVNESRLHLEEKVRVAGDRIEAAQRSLAFSERLAATGRLAAGVAHEINNPLGGVMNAIARLQKGGMTPERTEKYWKITEDGLDRIRDTVRRILDFSRKHREVIALPVTVPLEQSLDLARHLFAPARVTAAYVAPAEDERDRFAVRVDPGDLQHVFLNLIVNAVDAMPDGGVLTITVDRDGESVRVVIADTGVGMDPDQLSASFDYFHTTKPVGKGTGLGLSIAHHIVAGYRGTLVLESERGRGTTATVTLPATTPETGDRGETR
ncbi:MAG: HAMP domain-containing histidine kinase [Planctomycetes bacterium]|nr:HAMP domain-containing histidine kinase [Planctomycetota bacterium]